MPDFVAEWKSGYQEIGYCGMSCDLLKIKTSGLHVYRNKGRVLNPAFIVLGTLTK